MGTKNTMVAPTAAKMMASTTFLGLFLPRNRLRIRVMNMLISMKSAPKRPPITPSKMKTKMERTLYLF